MWETFEDYRVDISKQAQDAASHWDHVTKYDQKYHVEMALFSQVVRNDKPYGQAYYAEIQKGTSEIQTKIFIFPDRLIKITEPGTDEEIRNRMREYVALQTNIKLEDGQDKEETIEIPDNIILRQEIEKLNKNLENVKQKRIGF